MARIEAVVHRHPDDPAVASTQAIFLALDGKRAEASTAIRTAVEAGKHLGHFHHIACNIAAVYSILNERDLAIEWLEKATSDGFPCSPWLERDACLNNVRGDARFIALVENVRRQGAAIRRGA